VVIVGGSAIELNTRDAYLSWDPDLVGDRERLIGALECWGCKKSGRISTWATFEACVDPVGPTSGRGQGCLREVV